MTSRLLIPLFLLIPLISIGQEQNSPFRQLGSQIIQQTNLRLHTGLNFSTLHHDTINFYAGTRPFVGASLIFHVWKMFDLIVSADYSVKSSNTVRPYKKTANQYAEWGLLPSIKIIPDLYLHGGVSYAQLIKSNEIINNGDSWNGSSRIEIEGYSSEWNVLAGATIKLKDNVNLLLNYTIPTNSNNTSNFQAGVSYALNHRVDKQPSYRKKKKLASSNQIQQLKSGVMLVRLKTSANTINALQKAGKNDRANRVKQNQDTENKKIISAFKNHFDFCDLRFFYSHHTQNVQQKQFENIFLNDSLEVDPSIKMDTTLAFLLAEFGYIEQDTAKLFSHYAYESSENGSLEKATKYYSSSTEMDFYALRIMDENFVQLNRPFPYYTRISDKSVQIHANKTLYAAPTGGIFLPRSYEKTIAKMNRKLNRFYYKVKSITH